MKDVESKFEMYISQTVLFETGGKKDGAYTNDPDDEGGETKFGISKKAHPSLRIKTLTYKRAIAIYKKKYYHPLYEKINSSKIAFKLLDMSVLMGTKSPIRSLQRTLKRVLKVKLKVDGIYGPLTHKALNSANRLQEKDIYSGLIKRIGYKLIWISWRKKNRKYLKGWMKRANFTFKG